MKRLVRVALLEDPFEVLIAGLCVVSGVPLLLFGPSVSPGSVGHLLPTWLMYAWSAALFTGGSSTLIGKVGQRWSSMYARVEQAGMALLAAAAVIYAIALVTIAHRTGANTIPSVAIYTAFAGACVIRYFRLYAARRNRTRRTRRD